MNKSKYFVFKMLVTLMQIVLCYFLLALRFLGLALVKLVKNNTQLRASTILCICNAKILPTILRYRVYYCQFQCTFLSPKLEMELIMQMFYTRNKSMSRPTWYRKIQRTSVLLAYVNNTSLFLLHCSYGIGIINRMDKFVA